MDRATERREWMVKWLLVAGIVCYILFTGGFLPLALMTVVGGALDVHVMGFWGLLLAYVCSLLPRWDTQSCELGTIPPVLTPSSLSALFLSETGP